MIYSVKRLGEVEEKSKDILAILQGIRDFIHKTRERQFRWMATAEPELIIIDNNWYNI